MKYSKCGNGYIAKEPLLKYWYVFLTPIANVPVGGLQKHGDRFIGCAYHCRLSIQDNPEAMVNAIVEQAKNA